MRWIVLCALWLGCGGGSDAPDAMVAVDAGSDAATCPAAPLGVGDHDLVVSRGGRDFTFRVHVPVGLDVHAPAPVVLFFHGGGGDANGQELIVQLLPFADAKQFILVRGEGFVAPSGNGEIWNAGSCCGAAADTALAID